MMVSKTAVTVDVMHLSVVRLTLCAAVEAVAVVHSTILRKYLSSTTSDPIDARLCHLDGGENIPLEFIQLHVK